MRGVMVLRAGTAPFWRHQRRRRLDVVNGVGGRSTHERSPDAAPVQALRSHGAVRGSAVATPAWRVAVLGRGYRRSRSRGP